MVVLLELASVDFLRNGKEVLVSEYLPADRTLVVFLGEEVHALSADEVATHSDHHFHFVFIADAALKVLFCFDLLHHLLLEELLLFFGMLVGLILQDFKVRIELLLLELSFVDEVLQEASDVLVSLD